MRALKHSYGLHLWYEHVLCDSGDGGGGGGGVAVSSEESNSRWILRPGPMDAEISVAGKRLTFEEGRAKVLFLERQSRLLK